MMCMQHHGHLLCPSPALGNVADTAAQRFAELFQKAGIAAGQGIGPFRVDDFVIRTFHGVPAEVARVRARYEELPFCAERNGRKDYE